MIGAGYALAALAARRGRSVQQMLARAIFGVTGNMIPAAVLLLTKVVALAVVFLIAAEAATKLIPQIPAAIHADFRLFGYLISLPMVLMVSIAVAIVSWLLTLATGRVLEVLRISLAVVNVLFVSALVALGETLGHGAYRAGFATYDLAQSLTVASALIVVFGLLWSTTAADENLNLRSSTIAPKLIAAGLLNWILVGAAALVAGFIYQSLDASPIYMLPLGITVVVGSLFALSAILRQTSNLLVGLRIKNPTIWHSLLISLLSLGLAIYGFSRFGSEGVWLSVVAYLPVVGVPVSAWLGIFAADVVLRKLDYHQVSLEKNYGF